jgi:hypothetical protein
MASSRARRYSAAMSKSFFPRPAWPSEAYSDLRSFMRNTETHKWVFAGLALAIPAFFVMLFLLGSKEMPYVPPEVTYIRMDMPRGFDDSKIRAFHDARAKDFAARSAKAKADQERARKNIVEIDKAMKKWGL